MYPSFYANGQECRLVAREGMTSYDLVVVSVVGGVEIGWGGSAESGSIIVPDFDDAYIMRPEGHGTYGTGRRAFILWGVDEAKRRALDHFQPPSQDNKTLNVIWNMQFSVHTSADKTSLDVAPAPLP